MNSQGDSPIGTATPASTAALTIEQLQQLLAAMSNNNSERVPKEKLLKLIEFNGSREELGKLKVSDVQQDKRGWKRVGPAA